MVKFNQLIQYQTIRALESPNDMHLKC